MSTLDLALKTPLRHSPQEILGWTVRRNRMHAIRPIAGGSTPPAPAGTQDAPPQGQPTGQPTPQLTIPGAPTPPPAPAQQTQTFDPAAERERIRQELQQQFAQQLEQERQQMDARLGPIEAERAERERQAQEAERQRLEAERQAREAEETAAQTALRLQQENQAQIEAMQHQLAQRDAIIQQEQRMNALADYTRRKVEEVGDQILPYLRVNVFGSSEQEIDQRLSQQIEITNSILGDIQARDAGQVQLQQQQAQLAPGVTPTAPTMGPLEGNGAGQPTNFSPAQIAQMSPAEYAQHRQALLAWTSQARLQQ